MTGLKLKNLEKYRDEILKAEISALLFNLGKTHIGFWHEKNGQDYWDTNFGIKDEEKFKNDFKDKFGYSPFSGYKNYHYKIEEIAQSPFEYEIEKSNLEDFIFNQKVKLPFENELNWVVFFKGDALNEGETGKEFIDKIFFRGCENINSGIDKGSPKEQLKGNLWISNTFGSFKKKVQLQDFDDTRNCFFYKLHKFLYCNNYHINPDWSKIRKFVFTEIKNWYSRLLSDSRFPVNDVTLWDQAYMTATMFKAVLAQLCMNSSKFDTYKNDSSSIKWRILGIQYDKLGLVEKGYKPQQIQWYRETSREIDDEIKTLLEYEYPIGNEIYRDETGIYFLVGEELGEDLNNDSNLARLKSELKDIEEKIMGIFKTKSIDEFYPAIFLTKASRGLMNLSYLLEKAKENFLKANWSKKETEICIEKSESGRAIGICQVCRQRLVFKSDKSNEDKIICNTCYREKTQGRIDKWLENVDKETIWIDELKDKNGKVALVTMKFELHDWLSGDMLNGVLIREEDYNDYLSTIKEITLWIKSQLDKEDLQSLENPPDPKINKFLKLFDENGIQRPYDEIYKKLKDNKNIDNISEKKGYKDLAIKLLVYDNQDGNPFIEQFKFFNNKNIVLDKNKSKKCTADNYHKQSNYRDYLYKIFSVNYLILQIQNIILERSIGDRWEEFIKQKLGNKIDFKYKKIYWQNLTDDDIDFLSTLILQFLLRKNPSPARLRRIWESTREFFEEIKANICAYAAISQSRRQRYYWENVDIPEGEYCDGEAVFWAYDKKVYLISYLPNLEELKEKGYIFNLKSTKEKEEKENSGSKELDLSKAKEEYYIPCLSIIEPTPISWQFIIPAEYVPNLIDNVIKKYNESFKFVYGKLPLHIGVVVQDYKKPLYVGIKALRKIRRDIKDIEMLKVPIKAAKIKEKLKYQKIEESLNDTQSYYSLYKGKDNEGYEFYIKPNDKGRHWIVNINKFNDYEKAIIIPNTFDFEFLDTNTRRNEIYYDKSNKWKRKVPLKSLRPYDLETWEKFKKFKELFSKENRTGVARSTRLQKMISVIYNKLEDLRDIESAAGKKTTADINNEGIKAFLSASFINILRLKEDKELAEGIKKLFDIDKSGENDNLYRLLKEKMTLDNLQFFLDMYEFWHKAIGEV